MEDSSPGCLGGFIFYQWLCYHECVTGRDLPHWGQSQKDGQTEHAVRDGIICWKKMQTWAQNLASLLFCCSGDIWILNKDDEAQLHDCCG